MNRFEKLLTKASIVTGWFRREEAKPFIEYLEDWYAHAQKGLETAVAPHDLYRAQGEVLVLRRILDMRQDITAYQKDVAQGKVKPVTRTMQ